MKKNLQRQDVAAEVGREEQADGGGDHGSLGRNGLRH